MNKIDEFLKGTPLPCKIVRPERAIARQISIERENAEEKREATRGLQERMSFQVQDHIAFRALWQGHKTASLFDRQLTTNNVAAELALQLKSGLVMEYFKG